MLGNHWQKYTFYGLATLLISSCSNQVPQEKTETLEFASVDTLSYNDLIEKTEMPDTLEQRLIAHGLVDVQSINPKIRVELKYSTEDNFMRTNVYGSLRRAYLQPEVAEKLSKAQEALSKIDSNLFLLVYDAVRPQWVQFVMWNLLDTIPIHQRTKFVSNPSRGSVHNYGAAVDLTICDVNGAPLDMGAAFDDFREIAYPSKEAHFLARGELTELQIKNRQLLRKVMKLAGFNNIPTEWWHFNAYSREIAKSKFQIIP